MWLPLQDCISGSWQPCGLPLPDCVWTIYHPKATDYFTYFRIRQTPFFPGSAGLYLLRRSEWWIRLLFRLAGGNIVLQRFILKEYSTLFKSANTNSR
jgi:hypothetical protein